MKPGEAKELLRQAQEAITRCTMAMKPLEEAEARARKAALLGHLGQLDEALAELALAAERSRELGRDDKVAEFTWGQALISSRDPARATRSMALLQQALVTAQGAGHQPLVLKVRQRLIQEYGLAGQWQPALGLLDALLSGELEPQPRAKALQQRANYLHALHQSAPQSALVDRAAADLAEAITLTGDALEGLGLRLRRELLLFREGRAELAAVDALLEQAVAQGLVELVSQAGLELAGALLHLERFDEAAQRAETASQLALQCEDLQRYWRSTLVGIQAQEVLGQDLRVMELLMGARNLIAQEAGPEAAAALDGVHHTLAERWGAERLDAATRAWRRQLFKRQ